MESPSLGYKLHSDAVHNPYVVVWDNHTYYTHQSNPLRQFGKPGVSSVRFLRATMVDIVITCLGLGVLFWTYGSGVRSGTWKTFSGMTCLLDGTPTKARGERYFRAMKISFSLNYSIKNS